MSTLKVPYPSGPIISIISPTFLLDKIVVPTDFGDVGGETR